MAKSQMLFCQMAMDELRQAVRSCLMAKKSKTSPRYRFKEMRDSVGLTLEELAADVDISVSQLSRFESGDREPRVDDLLRIAARLGKPWQDFIEPGTAPQGSPNEAEAIKLFRNARPAKQSLFLDLLRLDQTASPSTEPPESQQKPGAKRK